MAVALVEGQALTPVSGSEGGLGCPSRASVSHLSVLLDVGGGWCWGAVMWEGPGEPPGFLYLLTSLGLSPPLRR